MNNDQITALAREYAEWICPYKDKSANLSILDIREAERLINFLLRRYYLVEKSKFQELEIARKAKEHGAVWLSQWEAESLFPEIGKEVEE